jgi:hypothetical protein
MGRTAYFKGAEYWPTLQEQTIITYGHLTGWIVALFKGVTKEEIASKHPLMVVTVSDVLDHKTTVETVMGESSGEFVPFDSLQKSP